MSNNHLKGAAFAKHVHDYLKSKGLNLKPEYRVDIGVNNTQRKAHRFDLGNESQLVECKAYNWTKNENIPVAKLTTVNEAMLHFLAAPKLLQKNLFMLATKRRSGRNTETLAEYYVRIFGHLIPDDVKVYEFDPNRNSARRLWPTADTSARQLSEIQSRSQHRASEDDTSSDPVFHLKLGKTYYKSGFFNITREFDHCVGDEGPVTLVLSGGSQITGRINRSANPNKTPRIHGRAALRDWFQSNYDQGDKVPVRFKTPRQLVLG